LHFFHKMQDLKLYYGSHQYMLKSVAKLEKSKSRRGTCRLCLKKIHKGKIRFFAVRGNLDQRMYHWKCALKDGFTLHHSCAKEFPSVSKAFRARKNKGPVKKVKKRANEDNGKRKKKRRKTSTVRPTWTRIMKSEDVEHLHKLNPDELAGLCYYNNIEIFGVNKEKVTIVRSREECLQQLRQISVTGWRNICPCGGRWDYQVDEFWRHSETKKGVRCMGYWENSLWNECTQEYKRCSEIVTFAREKRLKIEPFSSIEDMPTKSRSKKIDFPNPYLCDEVGLLREIFQNEICIEGEMFDINEQLTEEIASYLTPFPKYFVEVVRGKFGKAAMPHTSMLTIGGFKKLMDKKQKKGGNVKKESSKKQKRKKTKK